MSTMQLERKNISIRTDQAEFLEEADHINFSGFVRSELDDLMEREGELDE